MTDERKPILQQPKASDEPQSLPRRATRHQKTELPSGYRSSRRGSKVRAQAEKQQRAEQVADVLEEAKRGATTVGWVVAWSVGIFLAVVVALLLLVTAINGVARWNAQRIAAQAGTASGIAEKSRQNTLYIGVQGSKPVGFLATRVDVKGGQAFGIAIPAGAFMEIPGQGFERLGDSYPSGPDVMMSAVSNFIGVPFAQFAVVPAAAYQKAVKGQSLAGLIGAASKTNLSEADRTALANATKNIPPSNTAIVPLPVKPIPLGDQTYLQPALSADFTQLIKQWWGVSALTENKATRVIVFNGAGVPGIAGVAAQQLIRAGMRVVDTKNADKFTYKQTLIIVQSGPLSAGNQVAKVLGVGRVISKPADQDVAEVLVIIGKDYKVPAGAK